MKASIVSAVGAEPKLGDWPKPVAGSGEILVKNYAASIYPVDWKMSSGTWWGVGGLLMDQRGPAQFPWVFGGDGAGCVEAVGPNVHDYKVGDEVFYSHMIFLPNGAYAEYAAVDTGMCALKPKSWSWEEAASAPLTGQTALDMITSAKVGLGDFVIVNGASGGVGSMAVQLAVAAGAFVVAICGASSADHVTRLGARAVIDYATFSAENTPSQAVLKATGGQLMNAWLDCVTTVATKDGNPLSYKEISKCMAYLGHVVTCDTHPSTEGGLGHPWLCLSIHETFVRYTSEKLRKLARLGNMGKFKADIDSVFPLADVAGAWAKSKTGRAKGKIVLKIA